MPETLTVTIAPISGVALIQVLDGKLYSLMRDREIRVEHAPQMFNLHLDESRRTVQMEDEYPFEKVRHELEVQATKGELVHLLASTMDVQLSDETRHSFAERATEIVRNYPDTMEFARKIMLGSELPAEAEIKDEVLGKLSQPLQELFQEMVAKWRS